jgi:hypothetical protein
MNKPSSQTTSPCADSPADVHIHDLTDAARRLRAVASHIDSFLAGQLQRLSDAMHVYTKVKTVAEAVRRLFADLDAERQAWEAQRDAEIDRLQRASNSLIGAWEQLDAMQRQMLLDPRRSEGSRAKLHAAGARCRGEETESSESANRMPEQIESTLLEIQLLKREIVTHAQRRK